MREPDDTAQDSNAPDAPEMPDAPARLDASSAALLLQRVSKGDERALEEFYETYFSRLYRFVFYRVGRDHHHSEEVIHDTFMEAVEKAGRYDPARGSVESWLITISRNRIRSTNAMMTRPHEYEKSWSMVDGELEGLFADMDRNNAPGAALESEHLSSVVTSTMAAIPQEYSSLLEMKYVTNLSIRDISKALNKTEKAVESQLTRARNAFREAFRATAAAGTLELGF